MDGFSALDLDSFPSLAVFLQRLVLHCYLESHRRCTFSCFQQCGKDFCHKYCNSRRLCYFKSLITYF